MLVHTYVRSFFISAKYSRVRKKHHIIKIACLCHISLFSTSNLGSKFEWCSIFRPFLSNIWKYEHGLLEIIKEEIFQVIIDSFSKKTIGKTTIYKNDKVLKKHQKGLIIDFCLCVSVCLCSNSS